MQGVCEYMYTHRKRATLTRGYFKREMEAIFHIFKFYFTYY